MRSYIQLLQYETFVFKICMYFNLYLTFLLQSESDGEKQNRKEKKDKKKLKKKMKKLKRKEKKKQKKLDKLAATSKVGIIGFFLCFNYREKKKKIWGIHVNYVRL